MILIDVPSPNVPRLGLDLICSEMEVSNLIAFTTSGPSQSSKTQGTLSIKCAFNGAEVYELDGRSLPVNERSYVIFNQGQRYASRVDEGNENVESLCIFFRPGFAEEVLAGLATPEDRLLDDPTSAVSGPLQFVEKVYQADDIVTPMLRQIHTVLKQGRPGAGWLEEQFHLLVERMLSAHRNVLAEMARLPAARRSTRVELYRRLSRARDYIETSYMGSASLGTIAREAHLSTYHFLRLFKHAFGMTPHQYITRLRLDHAGRLLLTTDESVSSICFDLGFESPTSFSLLFRRHFGLSPTAYRSTRRHIN